MVIAAARQQNIHPNGAVLLKAQSVDDLIIAGYASVELVDKQGDLITTGALNKAFKKFMADPSFTNVQLAHSNIQVGNVVPSYTDSNGRVWKSEVDDTGLFVVIKLRNDIEKAREVASEIRKGNLRAFSIGGQAFKRVNKSDGMRGSYREIQDMELHEVTICEKGINTESTFRILKEDKTMAEEQVVEQLHNVLERLSKRLEEDGEDKKPAFLGNKDKDKKDDKKEEKDEKMNYSDDGGYEKGQSFDDVITMDYLNWMENTLKSAGVDTAQARSHFEALEKGYAPGEDGASHRGQPPLGIVGEGSNAPKANFGSGGKGNKFAIRASQDKWSPPKGNQFVLKENVSGAQLEEAYEVFKAAAMEQNFKDELNHAFTERLQSELMAKANAEAHASYDARAPVDRLEKAVLELATRIDSIGTGAVGGGEIRKSAPTVSIPSTESLATMDWAEVHNLASKALRGGE
jgi:HK97 family phage prohead protease